MPSIRSWRLAVDSLHADLRAVLDRRLKVLVAYEAHGMLSDLPDTDGDLRHDDRVHTLVVVDDLSYQDLLQLAPLAAEWEARGLAVPLLLAPRDLQRSLDAFPLEFSQILSRHVVVVGQDPFAGLAVADADIRRACEEQVRSHLVHLREGFIQASGNPGALAELVAASAVPFRAMLVNIARLHGANPRSPDALERFLHERLHIPTDGVHPPPDIQAHRPGPRPGCRRDLPRLPLRRRTAGGAGGRMDAVMPRPHRLAPLFLALLLLATLAPAARGDVPSLTQPVNDFAGVIDPAHAAAMDRAIRALQQATGDVVVVATVDSFAPFADIREYAVKLFENHGRGIGETDSHNGLLVLVAVGERKVWIEVGYGLEEFITDGYAGETSREFMAPAFRRGDYGAGLEAGVTRIIGRIAKGRNVTLEGVPAPAAVERQRSAGIPTWLIILVAIVILNALFGRGGPGRGNRRGWSGGGWSGWNSGVGSFGGGGGGGFGGGFGGFGGGGSGGGGGGASW